MIRFMCRQIDILLRILADHGINRIICTPEERIELMSIGAEINHQVKDIFKINCYDTYRRWLREEALGKEPGRPGRKKKFSAEDIALVLRIATESAFAGLSKIVGEMKKLGISISENSVKKILKENNLPPANKRQHGKVGSWQKFVSNVDSLVACDFYSKPIYSLFGKVDAYVLVFIHLGTRRIWQTTATLNPNDDWCRQQAINACMWI